MIENDRNKVNTKLKSTTTLGFRTLNFELFVKPVIF